MDRLYRAQEARDFGEGVGPAVALVPDQLVRNGRDDRLAAARGVLEDAGQAGDAVEAHELEVAARLDLGVWPGRQAAVQLEDQLPAYAHRGVALLAAHHLHRGLGVQRLEQLA